MFFILISVISIIFDFIWWNFNRNSIDIDDEYLAVFKHVGHWLIFVSIGCKLVLCLLLILMNQNKNKCAYFSVNDEPIIRKNVDDADYMVNDYV